MTNALLRGDLDPHRPRRALDALDRCIHRCRVQIGHLLGGDLAHLLLGHGADLGLVRCARTLGGAGSLLQEHRGRRGLGDEGEGAVHVDRDHDRDGESGHLLVLRAGVELLAELHDVDLRLTERRAHWRRGRRLARFDLQLDLCLYFLNWRHRSLLPFSQNSSHRPTGGRVLLHRFFYLAELQFPRSRAAEDRHHHLQRLAVFVDLVDHAVEVGKRTLGDAHRLVLFELDLHPRLVFRHIAAEQDRADLLLGKRDRLVAGAQEARHPRGVLDHVPQVVVEIHLDQHVPRQKDPLHGALLAIHDLGYRLGRNHDAANLVLQTESLHPALQRLLHLALEARIGVDDVPLEALVDRRRQMLLRVARLTTIRGACGRVRGTARRGRAGRCCLRYALGYALSFALVFHVVGLFRHPLPQPLNSTTAEQMQEPPHDTIEHLIYHVKICRKGEDSRDHHYGRVLHLFERGRPDLAHLVAHVLQKTHPAIPGTNQLIGLLGLLRLRPLTGYCYCLRHLDPSLPASLPAAVRLPCFVSRLRSSSTALTVASLFRKTLRKMAGALGFEPRSSVLETDSLTVELTPLWCVRSGRGA